MWPPVEISLNFLPKKSVPEGKTFTFPEKNTRLMKTLLSIFTALLLAASSWSQTYNSGDKDLDASLKTINIEAGKDLSKFKLDITKAYNTTLQKVNSMFNIGMSAGDVFIAFELSTIARKPIENVINVYSGSKSKGWGAMAKELGIKPGSAEFHKLKSSVKNKSAKKDNKTSASSSKAAATAKPGKGNSGNGGSKGNGKKK
jgi:hypothetical protein